MGSCHCSSLWLADSDLLWLAEAAKLLGSVFYETRVEKPEKNYVILFFISRMLSSKETQNRKFDFEVHKYDLIPYPTSLDK